MTTDNQNALDTFMGHKMAIDTILERIAAHSDEHFGLTPEEVDWEHVGELVMVHALLRHVTDRLFREGDYSAETAGR